LRRQLNEELHNFYATPNVIRVAKLRGMRWVVRVARMGEMRYAYIILVENFERRRPLGRRPRRR